MSDPTEVIQKLWEDREQTMIRIARARDVLHRGLSFIAAGSYQGGHRINLQSDLESVIREALDELRPINDDR